MIQAIFFALLIVSLVGGYFAYWGPSKRPSVNPVKYVMDESGYTDEQTTNQKRTQEINVSTTQGIMQIRKQMDDIAQVQSNFLDSLKDQQAVLKSASKDARDVLIEAKKQGAKNDDTVHQLESLSSKLQDEQKLMVAHGQDLMAMNDQVTKNRSLLAEEVDYANANAAGSLNSLQQRYHALQTQASGYFAQIKQYNQGVRDQMDEIQGYLDDLARNTSYGSVVKQQTSQERIKRVLDHERQYMMALADIEKRNRDFIREAEEKLARSKERIEEAMQNTQDKLEQEHQKQRDQEINIQQRLEDQRQRIEDRRDR